MPFGTGARTDLGEDWRKVLVGLGLCGSFDIRQDANLSAKGFDPIPALAGFHPAALYVTRRALGSWLDDDAAVLAARVAFLVQRPRLLSDWGAWRAAKRRGHKVGGSIRTAADLSPHTVRPPQFDEAGARLMTPTKLAELVPSRLPSRLLTPQDVAARLAVSRSMVYSLIRKRHLAAVYIGRLPRVAETELDGFLARLQIREVAR